MHQHTIQKSKIISSGIYLPKQKVKSDEWFTEFRSEQQYNIPNDWMSITMGIEERRVAPSDAKPSDLAIPAAQNALDSLKGVDLQDIDLVIFCGIERDNPEPATAHIIQSKLGLNAKHAFDVANACFGFVDGLQVASNYIACGITKYALVVTGEVPSKVAIAVVDMLKRGVDIKTVNSFIGALSVGDAGGAVVLGRCDKQEKSGFELFNSITMSDLADKCHYKLKENGAVEGHMMMSSLTLAFIKQHYKLLQSTLDELGWSDFDWVLSHQIGQKPFEKLGEMNGFRSSRMIKTLDKLGNITSATFPVNFQKLVTENKVNKGDRIGGCFAGSGIVIGQFGYTF